MTAFALALLVLAAAPAAAPSASSPAPPKAEPPAAGSSATVPAPVQQVWERLLALEGTWSGKGGEKGGEPQPMTVTYRVTANRSVVVETLFSGTPHEMVTMYHLDGAALVLTHYCAARNQPHMKATLVTPDEVAFEFVSATNLSPGASHMHAARIRFPGPDKLHAEWTSWQGGKPGHVAVFELARAR